MIVSWKGFQRTVQPPFDAPKSATSTIVTIRAQFQSHVILPTGLAFTSQTKSDPKVECNGEKDCIYKVCGGSDCHRDVQANHPGLSNTAKKPYAALGFNRAGECRLGPQVLRFSRKYATGGDYRFLVEFGSGGLEDFRNFQLKVQVLTDIDTKVYNPPPLPVGANIWYVFAQNALDGSLTEQVKMLTSGESKTLFGKNFESVTLPWCY